MPTEPSVPATLIDRLPIGVMVLRGETILFANRTLLDVLGYETIDALLDAGGMRAVFGGPQLPASDGDVSATLLVTASGEPVAVDGHMQSVTWEGEGALLVSIRRSLAHQAGEKVKAAERAAAAAERRAGELQAVLDTATDGVVILDGEGRIIGLNRSAEALFGYEAGEVVGKGMLLLFAPESHRAAFDYLDGLKTNGVASVLNDGREVMGRVRQGGLVPLFMTIGRLGDAAGDRFCAVLRDMTSFKRAESELVSARHQAEQASSQKSDFLAKVSHEIRTPLSAIIGFAEVMMEERFGPLGNDRYRAYVRDIHTSGGHVISLINDLLDLSKIEAGKLDLTFTSVNLNEVVQQSVAIMQPQANRDRIIIRTALAAGLPNVVADGRSIRQIALNLLSNSIKFTMPGGQVIVSTSLSETGEAIVRVRDTGVGMTETELAVAMEPFRQVSTTPSSGGTGLGLPLTKALVEANRATFSIQSAKNAGTIVEVVFPPTRVLAE
jgi:PAS domain S-box-containing protein